MVKSVPSVAVHAGVCGTVVTICDPAGTVMLVTVTSDVFALSSPITSDPDEPGMNDCRATLPVKSIEVIATPDALLPPLPYPWPLPCGTVSQPCAAATPSRPTATMPANVSTYLRYPA